MYGCPFVSRGTVGAGPPPPPYQHRGWSGASGGTALCLQCVTLTCLRGGSRQGRRHVSALVWSQWNGLRMANSSFAFGSSWDLFVQIFLIYP